MSWILKGLSKGIVTSRYPRKPDGYGGNWRASVAPRSIGAQSLAPEGPGWPPQPLPGQGPSAAAPVRDAAAACPTGAIHVDNDVVAVDRGRCILCGRCVAARPDLFRFDPTIEIASLERRRIVVGNVVGNVAEDDQNLHLITSELRRRTKALRRSVHVRHVDSGSDGSDEWEVAALTNPIYDVARLGIFFTASPRHADLLLITGACVDQMREPLARTLEAMPHPRVVMAAGVDAISGGMISAVANPGDPSAGSPRSTLAGMLGSPAGRSSGAGAGGRAGAGAGGEGSGVGGGVSDLFDVDVWVPGSPPSPFSLLHGILLAVGILGERSAGQLHEPARAEQEGPRRQAGRQHAHHDENDNSGGDDNGGGNDNGGALG